MHSKHVLALGIVSPLSVSVIRVWGNYTVYRQVMSRHYARLDSLARVHVYCSNTRSYMEEVKDDRAIAPLRWTSGYALWSPFVEAQYFFCRRVLRYIYELLRRIFICEKPTVAKPIATAAMSRLLRSRIAW